MTIGWALVIVAVLWLIERHKLWTRAFMVVGVLLAMVLIAGGIFIAKQKAEQAKYKAEPAFNANEPLRPASPQGKQGRATAYICENYVCNLPRADPPTWRACWIDPRDREVESLCPEVDRIRLLPSKRILPSRASITEQCSTAPETGFSCTATTGSSLLYLLKAEFWHERGRRDASLRPQGEERP